MFEFIYIEREMLNHPQVLELCHRFPTITKITCERYGEVFNRHGQNFRLQKGRPSLILAKKFNKFILPTPEGYGIGRSKNVYFSHMLNCIYDCRYCFLQGMYNSAHYVIFINFDDFVRAIEKEIEENFQEAMTFFSGYDCDSLALEPLTHFVEKILPTFSRFPQAQLELRTKSNNIKCLLKQKPLTNCIVAFSLTPKLISESLEHKAPSLKNRLKAIQALQKLGWPIGLRFDPIIYCDDFEKHYQQFFQDVFQAVNPQLLHSVTLGTFRLPKGIFKKISHLFPDEKLFAYPLEEKKSMISYSPTLEQKLVQFCKEELLKNISSDRLFFNPDCNLI